MLTDDARIGPKIVGDEIHLQGYERNNCETLAQLAECHTPAVRQELGARLADEGLKWEMRLLYAALLASWGDTEGRHFLLRELGQAPDNRLPDLFHAVYLSWRTPWQDLQSSAGKTKSDERIATVMLDVVQAAIRKEQDIWTLWYAPGWLLKRHNEAVIDVAAEGLRLDHVFSLLTESRHPPYLAAVRSKLKDLQDGDLTDAALYRQRTARAHAELILIVGEEKDPATKLVAFVEDTCNAERDRAVSLLRRFNDQRVISWAAERVRTEQDWLLPFCLIELLGNNRTTGL